MEAVYHGTVSECQEILIPYIEPPVPAGAPGPPEHYRERRVDLNSLFLDHPNDTYIWKAQGESMFPEIHDGDYLVIDRKVALRPGDVLIAMVEGKHTVKRIAAQDGKFLLMPDNPSYKAIPIDPDDGIRNCGVVLYAIHSLRGPREVNRRPCRLQ